jgi:hypothetical protein
MELNEFFNEMIKKNHKRIEDLNEIMRILDLISEEEVVSVAYSVTPGT